MTANSSSGTDRTEPESDSWDWLTVMDGPEVSGKGRIWFGHHDTWEKLNKSGTGSYVAAEPVEHIPLPRPMTRVEIEDWLDDGDYGDEILSTFNGSNSHSVGTGIEQSEGRP